MAMKRVAWAAAVVLCLTTTAWAQGPQARKITGKVEDGAGKPVAGAEVATFWIADTATMQPYNGAKSDGDGKFLLEATFYGLPQSLLALDKERKRGGLVILNPKSLPETITIQLAPLVHVHGDFFCKEIAKRPSWTNVYMSAMPGRARVLQCSSPAAKVSFWLPPGKYEFWGYGSEMQNKREEMTLAADKPDVDLKTVDVPATVIAKHVGKAPPKWNVTDARGLKKDVRLEDLKGKWVLVEFWGFW
jgi:hypothetical protein